MKVAAFSLLLAAFGPSRILARDTPVPPSSALADLYGQGLVISHDDKQNFWQVKGNTNDVHLVDEPEEFYSRFFVVQGNADDSVHIRMGKFEFLCVDESDTLVRVPLSRLGENRQHCEFTVRATLSGEESVSANKLEKTETFTFQANHSGRFLRNTNGILQASAVSEDDATAILVRDERNVIVDLGYLEQYLIDGNDSEDAPSIFVVNRDSDKLMSHNNNDKVAWTTTNENSPNARWTIQRMSRLNNVIRFRNEGTTEHLCLAETTSQTFGGQRSNLDRGICDWIPVRLNEREFAFYSPHTEKFLRILGQTFVGAADQRYSSGAAGFFIKLAEPKAAAFEILNIAFDTVAVNTIGFAPDEVKTVRFSNASPVEQEQVVEFSETKSVTSETTWSSSFFTESSVSVETSFDSFFASGSVSASLTVGFSTEQGRTHSTTEESTVAYSKTFTVPACTQMDITIGTSPSQKTAVPFIATIRQNNVDGSFKVFEQTGSHSGIQLDQTQVQVDTRAIEGCVAVDQRRLRGIRAN